MSGAPPMLRSPITTVRPAPPRNGQAGNVDRHRSGAPGGRGTRGHDSDLIRRRCTASHTSTPHLYARPANVGVATCEIRVRRRNEDVDRAGRGRRLTTRSRVAVDAMSGFASSMTSDVTALPLDPANRIHRLVLPRPHGKRDRRDDGRRVRRALQEHRTIPGENRRVVRRRRRRQRGRRTLRRTSDSRRTERLRESR